MSANPSSSVEVGESATPNILLVVLDTVRARNLSLYGHSRETTPRIDEFSESATVYTEARAPAPWTLPSHTSMFTGLPAHEHCVNTKESQFEGDTIHMWLRDQGYETGVFTENPFLAFLNSGLRQDFEHVHPTVDVEFAEGINPRSYDMNGRQYAKFLQDSLTSGQPVKSLLNGVSAFARSKEWLSRPLNLGKNPAQYHAEGFADWHQSTDGPWAACVNLMDAHAPYTPTEEFNLFATDDDLQNPRVNAKFSKDYRNLNHTEEELETIERLYDGGIRQADNAVGRILDTLEDRGELDETLVIITGDHGECFADPHDITERSLMLHHGGLNESLLHVPLVVQYPGQSEGTRVDDLSTNLLYHDVVQQSVSGNISEQQSAFTVDEFTATLRYSTTENSIHAVYTQDGDSVKKYVGDDSGTVGYRITGTDSQVEINVPDEYQDELRTRLSESVHKSKSVGQQDLTEAAEDRLSELGYI